MVLLEPGTCWIIRNDGSLDRELNPQPLAYDNDNDANH
jgi:hypothetical protein